MSINANEIHEMLMDCLFCDEELVDGQPVGEYVVFDAQGRYTPKPEEVPT